MMRGSVVRLGHADLRERALAQIARQHELRDARDVRLIRQRLQIEHEVGVFVERFRHSDRSIRHRQICGRLLLRFLYPPFDLADVIEILADPLLAARAESPLQMARLLRHRIEDAAVFLLVFELLRLIQLAGCTPVERDTLYRPVTRAENAFTVLV
jgi:hypothetical protein